MIGVQKCQISQIEWSEPAKLDVNLYEEVEADRQAMGVVVPASLAAGIGSAGTTGISGLLLGTVLALIGLFIWALPYFAGTNTK